jgi:hypothetical protein
MEGFMKGFIYAILLMFSATLSANYSVIFLTNGLNQEQINILDEASHAIGWRTHFYTGSHEFQLKYLVEDTQPDFIISFEEEKIICGYQSNYLMKKRSSVEIEYDGYFEWLWTCKDRPYEHTHKKYLFYDGTHDFDNDILFTFLHLRQYLNIYGEHWKYLHDSYRGILDDEDHYFSAMREDGIVLVMHTKEEIKNETPSKKAFEAISAGATVITDNPFFTKHFNHSVLQINPRHKKCLQIAELVGWCLDHPKKAERKAFEAHLIFSDKFSYGAQLRRLGEMHEKLKVKHDYI